jgi:hypothetical protein
MQFAAVNGLKNLQKNKLFELISTAADHATVVAQEKQSFLILTLTPVSF